MRVLLISFWFPPYNTIGAVRAGKLAKYLTQLGHEVRVVTARDQPLQAVLAPELPEHLVTATRWINVNRPVELLLGGRKRVAAKGFAVGSGDGGVKGRRGLGAFLRRGLHKLGRLYKSLLHYPDAQVGWGPFARRAASKLIREWRPDVIYASAAPYTSLRVANALSKRHGIPWVAELRDLWVDNANVASPDWRRKREARLERQVLSSAKGLVTVSEPLAERLRAKYDRPVRVILNGYDPEDLPSEKVPPLSETGLHLLYTGMVYEGKQDPAPLLAALQLLGKRAEGIRVTFYGRYLDGVREQARRSQVDHLVEVCEPLPYREIVELQSRADALLLLMWNDPRERGVYTGKLFEYLGARRPILGVGLADNVAGELIRERGAGAVLQRPEEIADQLLSWKWVKEARGHIPPLPLSVGAGLTRQDQAGELADFLREVLGEEEGDGCVQGGGGDAGRRDVVLSKG
jgi:glycosyltransferase involved in cell wall biosynthesis